MWRRVHADLTGEMYAQALALLVPFDRQRHVYRCSTGDVDDEVWAQLGSGDTS